MVIAAVILLSITVLLGALLLAYVLQGKPTPKAIALAHGLFAASSIIVLLIYALTTQKHHKHWDSLTIFIIAAIVGFYLFTKDIRYKKVPKWVAVVHALFGLGGFVWLLTHVIH